MHQRTSYHNHGLTSSASFLSTARRACSRASSAPNSSRCVRSLKCPTRGTVLMFTVKPGQTTKLRFNAMWCRRPEYTLYDNIPDTFLREYTWYHSFEQINCSSSSKTHNVVHLVRHNH